MIEPMIEAFTTVVRPAESAKMVMISSAALPKVALRTPPMLGSRVVPSDSVACPSTHASPTRARAETAKMTQGRGVQQLGDHHARPSGRRWSAVGYPLAKHPGPLSVKHGGNPIR